MIDSDFEKAVNLIQELPRGSAIEIKYEEKLIMYSLFQQATEGNVIGSRPSVFNNLERVKWDAWAKQKDLSTSEAKFMYCQTL
ncbi:acyl-CoA binding protein, partial [Wallemia mellicola CBS 633.66]